jgi:hypothetical protein
MQRAPGSLADTHHALNVCGFALEPPLTMLNDTA